MSVQVIKRSNFNEDFTVKNIRSDIADIPQTVASSSFRVDSYSPSSPTQERPDLKAAPGAGFPGFSVDDPLLLSGGWAWNSRPWLVCRPSVGSGRTHCRSALGFGWILMFASRLG